MNPKIPKSHQLQSSRFSLRIPQEKDIPFVFAATRHPGFNDGMLWDPPETEEELIEPLRRSIEAWQEGKGYTFSIVEKGKEQLLGRITIRKSATENVWNVGFWTHPEAQGKGLMSESLQAVLDFGFEELSAAKIEACHAIWNKASEKVLKRNGMTFEYFLEKGFQKKGEWVSENVLAIDRESWLDRRAK